MEQYFPHRMTTAALPGAASGPRGRFASVALILGLVAAACSSAAPSDTAQPDGATTTAPANVAPQAPEADGSSTTVAISSSTTQASTAVALPDAGWDVVADPIQAGLSADGLEALVELNTQVGSNCFAIVRQGQLVFEQYWNDWDATTDQEVYSTTKSVASVLIGIAQDLGHLSIEQPASDFIDEWVGTESEAVTIRSLLQNSSGREYDFAMDFGDFTRADDQSAFAVGLGQDAAPGEQWFYSNSAIQTLEVVLERAVDQDVGEFAQQHLFEPLGMEVELGRDTAGNVGFYAGMDAGCLDLARFMSMVHNDGLWGDQQIVSADYLADATSARTDLNGAYGYLFWVNSDPPWDHTDPRRDRTERFWPDTPLDAYMASGLADQVAMVLPSDDIVFVRIGSAAGQAGYEGVLANGLGELVHAAVED